jgi:hypothetical protein
LLLTELAFQNEEKKIGQLNYCCIPNLFRYRKKEKQAAELLLIPNLLFKIKKRKRAAELAVAIPN